jgi:hypothetical protein
MPGQKKQTEMSRRLEMLEKRIMICLKERERLYSGEGDTEET